MDKTHRWYLLLREWERTLRAENKSPATIDIYDCGFRLMVDWLDQLPAESTRPGDRCRWRSAGC